MQCCHVQAGSAALTMSYRASHCLGGADSADPQVYYFFGTLHQMLCTHYIHPCPVKMTAWCLAIRFEQFQRLLKGLMVVWCDCWSCQMLLFLTCHKQFEIRMPLPFVSPGSWVKLSAACKAYPCTMCVSFTHCLALGCSMNEVSAFAGSRCWGFKLQ